MKIDHKNGLLLLIHVAYYMPCNVLNAFQLILGTTSQVDSHTLFADKEVEE